MSRKTLYSNNAVVFVDESRVEEFETNDTESGISQAEGYVETNQSTLVGKKVEIFVKVKEYSFEEVKTVVMKEV